MVVLQYSHAISAGKCSFFLQLNQDVDFSSAIINIMTPSSRVFSSFPFNSYECLGSSRYLLHFLGLNILHLESGNIAGAFRTRTRLNLL